MMKLGVNVDHIATLRQARASMEPDPVYAAVLAEAAGADSIVVHLREDRRHIQERDLFLLRKVVKNRLNLEMSTSCEIVNIALKAHPDQVTLVPERRKELTTEGGLDVAVQMKKIKRVVATFKKRNIKVSLFIDPHKSQIEAAGDLEADSIELHTGCYANAKTARQAERELLNLEKQTRYAKGLGLLVNAGHGLNYLNVAKVAKIKEIAELNIGHSIISRAVLVGLYQAVKEMLGLIR